MTLEWAQFCLAVVIFILGIIGAVARISWIVSQALLDIRKEFNALLELKEAEFNGKIGKVWERFDVYKNTCDQTFVRQQTCTVAHLSSDKEIVELRHQVETNSKKLDAILLHLAGRKAPDALC